MASSDQRPIEVAPSGDQQDGESGHRELRRLAETFEAQWQDWIGEGDSAAESECLRLADMAYALCDLQMRAREMRLDFLRYLLGMAVQEALNELRAREAQGDSVPQDTE